MRGYFVAIRMTPSRRRASAAGSSPSTVANTITQRPVAEVGELVDLALDLLGEHVLARDAEVGGARLDVGRHVGGPHRDDPDLAEQQPAVVGAHLGGVDAEAGRGGRASRA
jgi:hypothetical protein